MKKYLPHIIAFAVGALITALVFLLIRANEKKIDERGVLVKTETITERDTIFVSRDDMQTEELPKVEKEYVYVQLPPEVIEKVIHDTTYIYKDIPLQNQHYHTKANDVEIWHSGIQSSIDSLINVRETKIVNYVYRKDIKHTVSLGVNVEYSGDFRMPLQLEYSHNVARWISIGVYAEYEPLLQQFGGGVTAKANISW